MKDLLVERPEIKLNDDDKIKDFLTYSKEENGVYIKIDGVVYKHTIDETGTCWLSIVTPFFEFDSIDELSKVLESTKNMDIKPKKKSKRSTK